MNQREIDRITNLDIVRFQQTGQMTEDIEQYFREVNGIADTRKISICSSRQDIAEQINRSRLPEEAVLHLRIKHLEKEAAHYNKDMREAAESFKRLKDWFIYFVHCEAVTLEDVMYRKTSSQSQKNRHRGMLYHMLRAYDGADFDRFAYRSINEKAARDVAEKYPYLPSLK